MTVTTAVWSFLNSEYLIDGLSDLELTSSHVLQWIIISLLSLPTLRLLQRSEEFTSGQRKDF